MVSSADPSGSIVAVSRVLVTVTAVGAASKEDVSDAVPVWPYSSVIVADAASYEPGQKTRLTDAIRRQAEVLARLETLEADWLDAHDELEQIG